MAQRSSSIYYVLENTSPEITYGPVAWSVFPDEYYSQGSTTWAGFDGQLGASPGNIQLSFDGIEIIFVGFTAIFNGSASTQDFTVAIDSNKAYTTSTGDKSPPNYLQWYQSPQLEPGSHSIKLDKINGTGVDYIVVQPGPDSPLTNQILMIDDAYVGINYVNHWESSAAATVRGNGSSYGGSTFQNTTHQTSIEGAYLNFSYFGTEMAMYGIYSWDQPGSYDLTITVDDQTPFVKTFNSSQAHDLLTPDQPNLKLFTTGDLAAGRHTVIANLSRCDRQSLVIDYIQYSPAFSSLATMPDLTIPQGSASAAGPSNTSSDTPSPSTKKTSAGAIAGGVVGGLALLAILALLFLWWYRRRNDESPEAPGITVEPFVYTAPAAPSSSFAPLRRNSGTVFSSDPPTSSGASFSGTNFTSPASFRPEIRQRMSELQRLIEEAENEGQIGDMRRQIQELRDENERLARMAQPPAYGDDTLTETTYSTPISPGQKLEPLRPRIADTAVR
ncbi:hypothetical protein C8J56DRAFT_239096 [Mycena floridula]|nr:hypothetical protein C8J56DRAFT_239096 [Mycena floridula]